MSKTNSFETEVLQHIFENAAITGIGDNLPAATTAGSLYIALFTSDPGETGTVTGEATYTGYARKAVARSTAAWTVTNDTVTNDAAIQFDPCTGGTNTITHFGICKAGTASVQDLIYYGTCSLSVSSGITPQFAASALTVTEG